MKKILLVFFVFAILMPSIVLGATPNDNLDQINQKVCDRFEDDVSKLAAIMDEVKNRQGIKETRVAFGGIDSNIKQADYWVTFAAEAIAYQRAQKFSTTSLLRSNLEVLKGKVLQAKQAVRQAL